MCRLRILSFFAVEDTEDAEESKAIRHDERRLIMPGSDPAGATNSLRDPMFLLF